MIHLPTYMPPKKLMRSDNPIKYAYKFSMDKPPADKPSKKGLRYRIGPLRNHGFLWYSAISFLYGSSVQGRSSLKNAVGTANKAEKNQMRGM